MAEKSIVTGLFGGSFNPIHIGHLALANYLCEYSGLDELWFLVSPHNPLKEQTGLLDDNLRLEMAQRAIEGYPRFQVSDFEFHLPRPSYMVHTLDKLKEAYPERDFRLIIGSDNWLVFHKWFEHERLLRENHLLVYPRPGYPIDRASLPPQVEYIEAPLLDISSTFIRESLQNGKDIRFFMPPAAYALLSEQNE